MFNKPIFDPTRDGDWKKKKNLTGKVQNNRRIFNSWKTFYNWGYKAVQRPQKEVIKLLIYTAKHILSFFITFKLWCNAWYLWG